MTKEQAVQWLFEHKDEEGSPDFERVLSQYKGLASGDPLKAAEVEYAKVDAQPDSAEKNAALDRLRTKISDLGGNPPLSKGPLVTQATEEKKEEKKVEAKPKSELPSQADFDAYLQEARKAQLLGGAAAATKYLPEVTRSVLGPTVGALSQAVEEGRMRAQPPAQTPVQSALPAPASTGTALSPLNQGSPAATNFGSAGYGNQTVLDRSGNVIDPRAPVQPTMDQTGRALQGNIKEPNTPMAQTGRASMTAFNQNTKDVAAGARQQQAVIDSLRNNPKSPPLGQIPGGFTGSSATGVALRPSALEPLPPPMLGQTGNPEPTLGSSKPQGPYINPQTIGDAAYRPPMPASQPVSGLEQVRNTFNRMASSPLGQEVTKAARVLGKGAGALGTIAVGSEGMLNVYDMLKALEDQKYGRAGMSAAKAAAMGLTLRTPAGLIPAAMLYGMDYLGDAQSRAYAKALHGMDPQKAYESEGGFYSANQ